MEDGWGCKVAYCVFQFYADVARSVVVQQTANGCGGRVKFDVAKCEMPTVWYQSVARRATNICDTEVQARWDPGHARFAV